MNLLEKAVLTATAAVTFGLGGCEKKPVEKNIFNAKEKFVLKDLDIVRTHEGSPDNLVMRLEKNGESFVFRAMSDDLNPNSYTSASNLDLVNKNSVFVDYDPTKTYVAFTNPIPGVITVKMKNTERTNGIEVAEFEITAETIIGFDVKSHAEQKKFIESKDSALAIINSSWHFVSDDAEPITPGKQEFPTHSFLRGY